MNIQAILGRDRSMYMVRVRSIIICALHISTYSSLPDEQCMLQAASSSLQAHENLCHVMKAKLKDHQLAKDGMTLCVSFCGVYVIPAPPSSSSCLHAHTHMHSSYTMYSSYGQSEGY